MRYMAVVKYGVFVTELKGKIAGQVFQKGNGANVLRNKGYARGASTVRRSAAVARMVSVSSLWRTLTAPQAATWVALSLTWVFFDKFGDPYYSSGYQVFVAYNVALLSMGLPTESTAGASVANEDVVVNTLEVTTPNVLEITTASLTTATMIMQIYASAPLSVGVLRTNLRYKLLGQLVASSATYINLGDEYVAAWGAMPSAARITCKFVVRNAAYPRIYSTFYRSAIVLP